MIDTITQAREAEQQEARAQQNRIENALLWEGTSRACQMIAMFAINEWDDYLGPIERELKAARRHIRRQRRRRILSGLWAWIRGA